jgi:hypothetical protein
MQRLNCWQYARRIINHIQQAKNQENNIIFYNNIFLYDKTVRIIAF